MLLLSSMKFRHWTWPRFRGTESWHAPVLPRSCFLGSLRTWVCKAHQLATCWDFYGTSFDDRQLLRAVCFIVVITFANTVMAKNTNKQSSDVLAVDNRIPLMYHSVPTTAQWGWMVLLHVNVDADAQVNAVTCAELLTGGNNS